jgi:hypothetical protein
MLQVKISLPAVLTPNKVHSLGTVKTVKPHSEYFSYSKCRRTPDTGAITLTARKQLFSFKM